MADSFRIGKLEHRGITITVDLEEGRNFRRITVARHRLQNIMGTVELYKVGEVHIYMDEVDTFYDLIERARVLGGRVGDLGFVEAVKEYLGKVVWLENKGLDIEEIKQTGDS